MGTLRWGSVMSVLLFLCTISIANARTVLRNANDALILDELFGDSPFPENDDFRWSYQEHGIPEEDVEQRNILMKVLRSKTQTRRKRPLGFENIDLLGCCDTFANPLVKERA
ncbi:unnamed protein product [Owenia fusiformis]|uniref:Uncharacterized protein n=1 Tax=Owenia fusiformis TaxID=6347 RepID=A0A8S4NWN3_OWEFU|nr:unnamed protein product [Owenia fusiformis]